MSNKTTARSRRKPPTRKAGERPLTAAERVFAEQRYAEALQAQAAAVRAARLWEETVDMLTAGDPDLGINVKTWAIVRAPKPPAGDTPKKEEP